MPCQCKSHSATSPVRRPGDICAVKETSAKLPFVQLLVNSMKGDLLLDALRYLEELKNPAITTGKATRPCVILESDEEGAEGQICLMATFEKGDPSEFPEIYRKFVVPMRPNTWGSDSEFGKPLHSCPEWRERQQWIIAVPIEPISGPSRTLQRWDTSRGFHLSKTMLDELNGICVAKSLEWEQDLERDKSKTAEYYYRDMMGKIKDRRSYRSYRSGSTRHTWRSSKYNQSTKSGNSLLDPFRGFLAKNLPNQVGPQSRQRPTSINRLESLHQRVSQNANTQASPAMTESSFSDADWPSLSAPSRSISEPLSHIAEDSAAEQATDPVAPRPSAPRSPPPSSSPVPVPDEAVTKQMSKLRGHRCALS
ncbi:hypothetical protein B0H11DRAFT_2058872 [Mycena galericulata]|nr:hypothetical protein B0H11DRAFT_2058872 [Mycena galericulata]